MKKLSKLLALALAVVMLLPAAALAAENEEEVPSKRLWMQWINWDEENYQPDTDIHQNNPLQRTPYDCIHIALYICDDGGSNPVPVPADQLKVDADLRVHALAPNEKGKEHYIEVDCARCEWGKDYAIIYGEYSFIIECRLPDAGMYSAPEAATENYLDVLGFSPLLKESSCYLISTATDENSGRHLVDMALNEDCGDNAAFRLEKAGDNVYKLTMTGSVNAAEYYPVVDVTWQNVKFMGGDTYVEPWEFHAWQEASTLVTSINLQELKLSEPPKYADVADEYGKTLVLKAGESVTVYTAFTSFPGDPADWIVRRAGAALCKTSDSSLKLATDEDNPYKLTISCDVPGTYTFTIDNSMWWPSVNGLTHANGTPYTKEEFQKWDEETLYTCDADTFYVVTYDEDNNRITTPFEEAFPGESIDWDPHYDLNLFAPVTVTVEPAASEKLSFTDVKEGDWYEAAVRFVTGKGYMKGDSATQFNPDGRITGAEFAQILYNKDGRPAAADGASFQGVAGQWYEPAMLWAAGKGIVTDTGDAAVEPEKALTRQQIALMLYNYLDKPESEAGLSAFADGDQVSSWAKAAMEWAAGAKVFEGSAENGRLYLDPAGTASRAQAAQILMNYFG